MKTGTPNHGTGKTKFKRIAKQLGLKSWIEARDKAVKEGTWRDTSKK